MPYVSTDANGNITGVYACPQLDATDGDGVVVPGIPTNEIADDDPALVAYLSPKERVQKEFVTVSQLKAALAESGISSASLDAAMVAVKE